MDQTNKDAIIALQWQRIEEQEITIAALRADVKVYESIEHARIELLARIAELEDELASCATEMTSRLFQIVELEEEVKRLENNVPKVQEDAYQHGYWAGQGLKA